MKSLVQSSILSRKATRVPFRQPLRSPCRNSAPCAQRKLLRTVASSVECLCQVRIVEDGACSDLGSAGGLCRGVISFAQVRDGNAHYQFTLSIVDHFLPFDLLSLLTSTRSSWSQSNLVAKYSLSYIFEKFTYISIVLTVISK